MGGAKVKQFFLLLGISLAISSVTWAANIPAEAVSSNEEFNKEGVMNALEEVEEKVEKVLDALPDAQNALDGSKVMTSMLDNLTLEAESVQHAVDDVILKAEEGEEDISEVEKNIEEEAMVLANNTNALLDDDKYGIIRTQYNLTLDRDMTSLNNESASVENAAENVEKAAENVEKTAENERKGSEEVGKASEKERKAAEKVKKAAKKAKKAAERAERRRRRKDRKRNRNGKKRRNKKGRKKNKQGLKDLKLSNPPKYNQTKTDWLAQPSNLYRDTPYDDTPNGDTPYGDEPYPYINRHPNNNGPHYSNKYYDSDYNHRRAPRRYIEAKEASTIRSGRGEGGVPLSIPPDENTRSRGILGTPPSYSDTDGSPTSFELGEPPLFPDNGNKPTHGIVGDPLSYSDDDKPTHGILGTPPSISDNDIPAPGWDLGIPPSFSDPNRNRNLGDIGNPLSFSDRGRNRPSPRGAGGTPLTYYDHDIPARDGEIGEPPQYSDPRDTRNRGEVGNPLSISERRRSRSRAEVDRPLDPLYLKDYFRNCDDCMTRVGEYDCPLHDPALDLKKWAIELQELLSYGCRKPEECHEAGKCCLADRLEFRNYIRRMTEMHKEFRSLIENECSECAVDCGWSQWELWSACDVSCGSGRRTRSRRKDNPPRKGGGRDCPGAMEQVEPCREERCCVPEHGNWASWEPWTSCSLTCGDGSRERRRMCTNPPPNECGHLCRGRDFEIGQCSERDCCVPVHGNWANWESWTSCSASCGSGVRERLRMCTNPRPNKCGRLCIGRDFEMAVCENRDCCVPVHGNWANWGSWTSCSVTCGSGNRERERVCTNPSPNECGRPCSGRDYEFDVCQGRDCCVPVHGNWANWGSWTSCSATCGTGNRERERVCTNPPPNECGRLCSGRDYEFDVCQGRDCCVPVNGNWANWGSWTSCSATCGTGNRERERVCTNPPPNECGRPCSGRDFVMEACQDRDCCVDGSWGSWASWSRCSATCDNGTQTRERNCDDPRPNYCGNTCPGPRSDSKTCQAKLCPKCFPEYDPWSSWGECIGVCSYEIVTRQRRCRSIPNCPPCYDVQNEEKEKSCGPAPVDGNWGSWQPWNSCSVSCGFGTRSRSRVCNNPVANRCGSPCRGRESDHGECSPRPCPPDCVPEFDPWTSWGRCTSSCGQEVVTRERRCRMPRNCPPCFNDKETDYKDLQCGPEPVDGNWGSWLSWDTCSVTCGFGTRLRSRSCNNPAPNSCGSSCRGTDRDHGECNLRSCPDPCVDGNWGRWASWTECSATCGRGQKSRDRLCDNPAPNYCGDDCRGQSYQTDVCDGPKCDFCVQKYTDWSPWTECTANCGMHRVTRERRCFTPPGCEPCYDVETDSKMTRCGPDRGEAQWTNWEQWSTCPVTCGGGFQSRRRNCFPGLCETSCYGTDDYQTRSCADVSCLNPCEKAWSSWTQWSPCTATCGYGTRTRGRRCQIVRHGTDCEFVSCHGTADEVDDCGLPGCCYMGPWTDCSATCEGYGFREREESCYYGRSDTPTPGRIESERCRVNSPRCPGYEWKDWEGWCDCNCRFGLKIRNRKCLDSSTGLVADIVYCTGAARQNDTCDVRDIRNCPQCILSCEGRRDGKYPSCTDCEDYIECTSQKAVLYQCKDDTEWDGYNKKCVPRPSSSCMLKEPIISCVGQRDGRYHSRNGCGAYVLCSDGQFFEDTCIGDFEFNFFEQTCERQKSPSCIREEEEIRRTIVGGEVLPVNDAPSSDYFNASSDLSLEEARKKYGEDMKTKEEEEEKKKQGVDEEDDDEEDVAENGEEEDEKENEIDKVIPPQLSGGFGLFNPDCITSCEGLEPGMYPSCRGCDYSAICTIHGRLRHRRCRKNRQWDNQLRKCRRVSTTCQRRSV